MGNVPSKLIICVDVGTAYLKVGLRIVYHDGEKERSDVVLLKFSDGENGIEQIMVLNDNDDDFVLGCEAVEEHLKRHPEDRDHVIRRAKMALYNEHRLDENAKAVYREALIDAPHYENGLSDFGYNQMDDAVLKPMFMFVRRRIKQYLMTRKSGQHVTRDEEKAWTDVTETRIPVPCNSPDKANDTMLRAAHAAGFPSVELQLEPLCAAVAIATELIDEGNAKQDSNILVVDVGGGTIDAVVVGFMKEDQDEGKTTFRVVGTPDGSLHGGGMINQDICNWVKHSSKNVLRRGDFDTYASLLGLSQTQLWSQLWDESESAKLRPCSNSKGEYKLNIQGALGASIDDDTIKISEHLMNRFCENQVKAIMNVVRRIREHPDTPEIEKVFLSGRSFRKKYVLTRVVEELEQEFDLPAFARTDSQHVVNGSLGRDLCKSEKRELPANTTFYTTRDEEWDPILHGKDEAVTTQKCMRKKRKYSYRPRATGGSTSSENEPPMLYDRLIKIMGTQEAASVPGEKAEVVAEMLPPVLSYAEVETRSDEDPCFHSRIYTMESPGYLPHTALRESVQSSDTALKDVSDPERPGYLRDGIIPFGTKFYWYIQRSILEEAGYRAYERDGKWWFGLYLLSRTKQKGDTINLVTSVFAPGQDLGKSVSEAYSLKKITSPSALARKFNEQQKDLARRLPKLKVIWTGKRLLFHPQFSFKATEEMSVRIPRAAEWSVPPSLSKVASTPRKRKQRQSAPSSSTTAKQQATAIREKSNAQIGSILKPQSPREPDGPLTLEEKAMIDDAADMLEQAAQDGNWAETSWNSRGSLPVTQRATVYTGPARSDTLEDELHRPLKHAGKESPQADSRRQSPDSRWSSVHSEYDTSYATETASVTSTSTLAKLRDYR